MKQNYFMSKTKRFLGKYLLFWRWLIFLALLAAGLVLLFFTAKGLHNFLSGFIRGPKMVVNFLKDPEENLNFTAGRTNILILGVGGGNHEGGDLTDTIIFASINIKTGDTVMVSIPRDIWSEEYKAKINALVHYGEERQKGDGPVLVRDAVYQIVNQPIHYTFLLDFEGFTKAIDLVGGIKVKVDRGFDDYKYPIPGRENDDCNGDPTFACRFEHLHFAGGEQPMDGATALQFVRSRNAQGEEGTDFARSARQQKVINALKDKLFSAKFLTSPGQWQQLLNLTKTYVKTDPNLEDKEIASFANLGLRFIRGRNEVRTLTLDTGSDENPGFLVNPPISSQYDNQWVLIPRSGDWKQFQDYFSQKIESGY